MKIIKAFIGVYLLVLSKFQLLLYYMMLKAITIFFLEGVLKIYQIYSI